MAYTTIDDPSEYFTTTLYAGNATDDRSITNSANAGNFKPDWVWGKNRSQAGRHTWSDSSRGATKNLFSERNDAEGTEANVLQAFETNGFQLGSDTRLNSNGDNFVTWQWKCNGGTTSTNDASATSIGTIDSVIQANTTAGFSIVTYTGTGSAGTIAHGLGKKPQYIILKNRSFNDSWITFHEPEGATKFMSLDVTGASSDFGAMWNDTEPNTSVFSIGSDSGGRWVNSSGDNYIAYCFTEIKGYSKFNSYTGTNNADGAFVYTGFKPAWVMVKRTDAGRAWVIHDSKQDTFNVTANRLDANTSEQNQSSGHFDFLSNGFKCRSTEGATNAASPYVVMAFAEHPFVSSKGVPITAR